MPADQVPTSNMNALYANTTPGTVASPAAIDAGLQDVVATVNTNAAVFNTFQNAADLEIVDQSIRGPKIRDGAVTTSKIADLAVTTPKIALGAVGSAQLNPTLLTDFGDIAIQAEFDRRGVNVLKYGAIGNGIANDTTAFINAIAAVPEGGTLYVPIGQYKITSTLAISKSIKMRGNEGTGANATTDGGSVILYNGIGSVGENAIYIDHQNVSIENLFVLNQGPSTIDGIVVNNATTSLSCIEFNHVISHSFKTGFSVAKAFLVNLNYCRAANSEVGFNVYNCDTTVNFHKCWALVCSSKGYNIQDLKYSNLINCAADQCLNPYYFNNCHGVSLYNCGSEVSTGINIQAINSTMGFYGCVSYQNNSTLTDTVSFAKFTGSKIVFQNCYEQDLISLSNNRSVLLDDTIINMHGSNVRFFTATVPGDTTSKVYGTYNKDGGVANDIVGDLATIVTPNSLGLVYNNMAAYVNALITQETTKYTTNVTGVAYNRPTFLTSSATGNPSPGNNTVIIPVYQDAERFYLAIANTTNPKLYLGYSSDSGSTITWRRVQDAASGTTANRPTTNLVTGQQYFDTTLNKPVWRNTANSGWVDATGTAV